MPMYVAVKDIGPLDREKAIRVKCVRCYEIAENRGSTEIKSREVLVCDKEGTFIHLNMQNSDVKKYKNVFIEGKLYSVKNFLVFTHYYTYKTCDHQYMIRLNYKTQVKAIKSKGFPNKMFQLKTYDSLKDPTPVNDKVLFDLIGRVVEIHTPVDKIIGGRLAKLLDFKMADNEGNTLQCTVWDSHVCSMLPYYDSGLKEPLILVLQLCRAKVVNGFPLFINIYVANRLTATNSPLRSISTATVLSQSTGIDDFTSGALTVTPVADLLKKKQYQEGMARYRVKVIVLDKGLRDVPFLLWDRECSELVGIPAHSLYTKYNKVSDIPRELESLVGLRMIFKISLKMEFMKGATSAYTVVRVLRDEVLVSAYCSKLIEDQEKDLMTKMIDEDEDEDEESDQEASNGDNEVNSPLSIQQSQSLDIEPEDPNGVKRSLLDQFSSSRKKGKNVVVKQEKL
ncbi:PREDICTED: uncharacterized protein LOC109176667 [Ipomoea nil]|uniref:uncharacterized protein LOC109176667 n=1 Tax=Ipomoea nil TaxID=35883 RepID=UPI000901EB7D|nr:PREDICTED: uncharacterized protein LOC109176667 [Ipomoea nil]